MTKLGYYKTQCDIWRSESAQYQSEFQKCLETKCQPSFTESSIFVVGLSFMTGLIGFIIGQGVR